MTGLAGEGGAPGVEDMSEQGKGRRRGQVEALPSVIEL